MEQNKKIKSVNDRIDLNNLNEGDVVMFDHCPHRYNERYGTLVVLMRRSRDSILELAFEEDSLVFYSGKNNKGQFGRGGPADIATEHKKGKSVLYVLVNKKMLESNL